MQIYDYLRNWANAPERKCFFARADAHSASLCGLFPHHITHIHHTPPAQSWHALARFGNKILAFSIRLSRDARTRFPLIPPSFPSLFSSFSRLRKTLFFSSEIRITVLQGTALRTIHEPRTCIYYKSHARTRNFFPRKSSRNYAETRWSLRGNVFVFPRNFQALRMRLIMRWYGDTDSISRELVLRCKE